MIRYEFECDTCPLDHWAEFQTIEEAREFVEIWELEGFKIWRAE